MTNVYDIANDYSQQYRSVPYPERPVKPKREDFPSNATYGVALDKYDAELATFRDKQNVASAEHGKVEAEFRNALAKELGLENHPKFDKLYSIAYQHGHSAGFSEVAGYAAEFAELLRD